jgi:pilus assembly protein CpaC
MRIRTALLVLASIAGGSLSAQTPDAGSARDLTLMIGKGELLHFEQDIGRVAVAEPRIADAIVVSPRDVMVSAKGPGHTTLVIWEPEGEPRRYEISVVADTTELDSLHNAIGRELDAAFPEQGIKFSGNADTLVLSGDASLEQSKRAEAIASTHTKKVVNLIQVPPTPDPREILLQVKFADVDRTALSQLGFNLFSRNPTMLGATSTQQFSQPEFSQLQFQNDQLSTTNLNLSNLLNLFIFRPDLNIGATVQMLQQQNVLQILAEPNLIVTEGSEASFLAGGEFPFPSITTTPTTGGIAPVVTVQFKKFGVQLNFTPTVTASGAIHLKVKPEVSSIDYSNAVTLNGFLIPAISSRVAETEIVLKDGESFAIAGLIDNRVTQVMNKVPALGNIPILGNLFRSRSTQKSTDELLVLITPRFVKPLTPGEPAKLPETVEPYLPPISGQKTAQDGKEKKKDGKGSRKNEPQPEFVGPHGYQEPN